MAKRQGPILEDNDDGSISVDLSDAPKSRKFSGTDSDPTDAETGEELFADLTPRLRTMQVDDTPDTEVDPDEEEIEADAEEEEVAEEAVVTEDDEDEEEEGASRSRAKSKFQKRLDREKRLREEEKAENDELRQRLAKLENAQKTAVDDTAFNSQKSRLDADIAKIRESLELAVEAGETKVQLKLMEELGDLKQELRTAESAHKAAKEAAKSAPTVTENTIVVTKVRQWMRKHPRFNRDPEFAALVRATDKSVAAAGFDPESDDFYAELDKRLTKRYPEEYPKARKVGAKPPSANLRNEGAGPAKRPGQEFATRNGRVTLTPRQVQNMRNFQLDPTNPADVREYVLQNRKG